MCSISVDEEEKAFLVMVDYEDQEYTYYISSTSAFNLAIDYAKVATLCIGSSRYQFRYGEPILYFAKEKRS